MCRAATSAKARGLNRKGMSGCPLPPLALFTARTYSFLVVIVVSMTTGDLSNRLISTLFSSLSARVCFYKCGSRMFISPTILTTFGASCSKVPTFTVLILPLKVLSYPKNNHHALLITLSMKARQCVASEKVAQNHRNDRTEPLVQKIKSSFMSFTCGDRRSRLPELRKRFIWMVTCHGSVLIYVMECTPRSLPTCHHLFCTLPFASSCRWGCLRSC